MELTILNQIIILEIEDLDIIFNLTDNFDNQIYASYIEDNVLEYYFGSPINDTNFNITKNHSLLNNNDNEIYYLTPTTSMTYTANGILLEIYGTSILINTTNDIDQDILKNYDYIISSSTSFISNTKNLIINTTTSVNDYNNLAHIYQDNPNIYIYDITNSNNISLIINKYGSEFSTIVTEISSLETWDYEYNIITLI